MTGPLKIRRTRQPGPVLEIGGTHVTAALVDVDARRVVPGTRCRQPMRADASAEEIVDRVLRCASRLEAPPGSRWGVAIPGPFDYARGIALFEGVAKFDALYGVDLGKVLTERLPGRPSKVTFLNDASAFALGEWTAGAARGHDRAVGITLGTGVGSAFLAQGSLVDDGPDVPPHGWVHVLSFAGHPLEHTISRRAIVSRYADIAKPAPGVIVDVREIAGRARAGDPVARRVLDDAFSALGQAVGPWLARFHATVLVVGGSIAASWDLIARPMREGLSRMETEVLSRLVLTQARQPEDAALLGAAWYATGDLSDSNVNAPAAQALTIRRPLGSPQRSEHDWPETPPPDGARHGGPAVDDGIRSAHIDRIQGDDAMSASEGSPPTMRKVAAHAGVSVMTVSRALHGDPRVSPQTRARVLAAAEELSYRRNELARSLRLGRPSGMLGLVVTNLANPFYSQLALGVETLAAARGMKVVLSNTGGDVERERQIVSDLAAWRVEGMIVVPAGREQSHLDPARLNGIPVVLAARPPAGIAVDCVLLDDYGGAKEATARLLTSGHRRIGFLSPPAVWNSVERLRGFRSVMEAAGIDLDERFVRCEQRDVTSAERTARELLALTNAPSAFFCANSRNAIGAYRAAKSTNSDIALSCFDDFELADMLGLPLSVVSYDPAAIGRESASLLLSRIDAAANSRGALSPRRIVLPTTVIDYGREAGGRLPLSGQPPGPAGRGGDGHGRYGDEHGDREQV